MTNLPVTFAASFLIWILFAGLFVLWFIDGKIKKEQVLHGVLAFILAWVIADILKDFFPTVRPYLSGGGEPLVLMPTDSGAFPSGHMAASFALAMTIFKHDRKIGAFYIVLAILIGISRIAANVHYPIDILGGIILGFVISILISKIHLTSST